MKKYSKKKILADKTGDGYIFKMFYKELKKIKRRPIETIEACEVLTALGYSAEDLESNPALKAGLNMAICAINDDVYLDNRPQPADYYHFTDKNGKAIKGFRLEWYVSKAIEENLNNLQFKIDFHDAITDYLLCEWGTMNRGADRDNNKSLKDPANAFIIGRYHTHKGDIYIKTMGNSRTEVIFSHDTIEENIKRFSDNEIIRNSEKTGDYTVYIHISPNGKTYIGMTENIKTRFGFNGSHYRGKDFKRDIKKFGWHNIEHGVIASGLTRGEAERLEHEAILLLRSQEDGYNQNTGGSGSGRKAVKCLNDGKIYFSLTEAGKAYNMCQASVSYACKKKTAGGLQFELLER